MNTRPPPPPHPDPHTCNRKDEVGTTSLEPSTSSFLVSRSPLHNSVVATLGQSGNREVLPLRLPGGWGMGVPVPLKLNGLFPCSPKIEFVFSCSLFRNIIFVTLLPQNFAFSHYPQNPWEGLNRFLPLTQ